MDAPTPKSAAHDLRSHHVRVGELEWKPTRLPGCEVKTLLFDRDSGLVTALTRIAPGAKTSQANTDLAEGAVVICDEAIRADQTERDRKSVV